MMGMGYATEALHLPGISKRSALQLPPPFSLSLSLSLTHTHTQSPCIANNLSTAMMSLSIALRCT
jgi:hypothetical protein